MLSANQIATDRECEHTSNNGQLTQLLLQFLSNQQQVHFQQVFFSQISIFILPFTFLCLGKGSVVQTQGNVCCDWTCCDTYNY
jgi:hypothetical protein